MHRSLPCLAAAAVGLLAGPAAAQAAPVRWSPPATFRALSPSDPEADGVAPRVAVAADGTTAVAWSARTGDGQVIRAAVRRGTGRMGPARTIARSEGSSELSVAAKPGGVALVAAGEGRITATRITARGVRGRTTLAARPARLAFAQVASDPVGGWVVLESVLPGVGRRQVVTGQRVTSAGRPEAPPVALGAGSFGNEARPVFALAVDERGTAYAAYRAEEADDAPAPASSLVRVLPHGGAWSAPAPFGAIDARLTPAPGGGAVITGTDVVRGAEVASFGVPLVARVAPDGSVGAPQAPRGVAPRRAFSPAAAALGGGQVLGLRLERARPAAFSPVAPVRAAVLDPSGGTRSTRVLATKDASEPVALPLSRGRALGLWAGPTGWGAVVAGADARIAAIRPPAGPPATRFHSNDTNRDVRSAGAWAAVAWGRGGVVRVTAARP